MDWFRLLSPGSAASAPVARLLGAGLAEQVEDPWWAAVVERPHMLADWLDMEPLFFAIDDEDDAPDPLRALASDSRVYNVSDLDRVYQLLPCEVLAENESDHRSRRQPSRKVSTRPGHIALG